MALQTPMTKLFGVKHPVMLAGMSVAAGPDLVCAVSNAGGLGVFGGVHFSPRLLKSKLDEIKEGLATPDTPFGVDLALPQVGGNARKTNIDYTHGHLDELIDLIIEAKPVLFVCAVGVPPKHVVDKLHAHGILYMNMIGHPKHAKKAIALGADLLCAQAGEGGGHTGEIPFTVLVPSIVEMIKNENIKSPMTGELVQVIAAGGIHNGKTLSMALAAGATGVWVGTRFVAAEESGVSEAHKAAVIAAQHEDIGRTLIFSGRPLSVALTPEVVDWHENRSKELKEMLDKGIIPVGEDNPELRPFLMGKAAAVIKEIKPAKDILEEMIKEALDYLRQASKYLPGSKL